MWNFGRKRIILLLVLAGGALLSGPLPAAGSAPQGVSPGAQEGVSVVEARCPTFSWGFPGQTEGYELVVYQLAEEGSLEIAEPVLQEGLPGSARSWTPSLDRCLSPGGRYAWLVRTVSGDEAGEWSVARLFEVAAGPSASEVEEALALLRRYVEKERAGEQGAPSLDIARLPGRDELEAVRGIDGVSGPSTNAAPTLGAASLTVDQQVHLAAGSSFFKNGSLFLWSDDSSANLALGKDALSSNTTGAGNTATGSVALFANTTGFDNTAHGFSALFLNTTGIRNTAIGNRALFLNNGSFNTASGYRALFSNTTGSSNTASGYKALFKNTTGFGNIASGYRALYSNTTGYFNIGLGARAGFSNTTGSGNIWIGSYGTTESNTLRIGNGTGTGSFQQTRAFISGIRNASGSFTQDVCVNSSTDQLGPCSASSLRFKEGIQEMAEASEGVFGLRPVKFRYKEEFAGETGRPVQYGLIAEEVAEIYPELVTYDPKGRPVTVRYNALTPLLLNELQEQQRLNATQEAELRKLRARVVRLETGKTARGRPVKNTRR